MGRYFETFIFNMMSRIIGAILRTFFIILGLISELFIIIAGAAALLVWLVSPLILIFGLFLGIKMIIF